MAALTPELINLIQSTISSELRNQLPTNFHSAVVGIPGDPTSGSTLVREALGAYNANYIQTDGIYSQHLRSVIFGYLSSDDFRTAFESQWTQSLNIQQNQDSIMALVISKLQPEITGIIQNQATMEMIASKLAEGITAGF